MLLLTRLRLLLGPLLWRSGLPPLLAPAGLLIRSLLGLLSALLGGHLLLVGLLLGMLLPLHLLGLLPDVLLRLLLGARLSPRLLGLALSRWSPTRWGTL